MGSYVFLRIRRPHAKDKSAHLDAKRMRLKNSLLFFFVPCNSTKRLECPHALGMESGAISDGQVTASSTYDRSLMPYNGRLNSRRSSAKAGSWTPASPNVNQWLQIDLGLNHADVTGVATQGRNNCCNQWVTKYKLQYSEDEVNFLYYREQGQSTDKVKRDSVKQERPRVCACVCVCGGGGGVVGSRRGSL